MWPWLDRTGRFSALRALTFALVIAPAVWLGTEAVMDWFGPRPVTEAIHQSGLWAIRLLALSLAITPLRAATRASKLIGVRRMIGVASFAYAALHLSLYVLDQHFALLHVASEIALRIYLTIGFATLVILSALAATSTDGMIKRLGAQRWTRLHKWVYAAAALGTIHFFMQSKLDVSEPIMMGGIFALLLADRALMRFVRDPAPWALAALAIGISLATALFEAGWYSLAKGAPFLFVLDANLDFSFAIRPAWFVLAAGMTLVAARILRVWIGGTAASRDRQPPAQTRQAAEAV
ncbi:sulfite oxidase heme-binding subunit YedZ [Methyloferula stellata]|uniref:sulfite oxidase heme-binding subunit YedZ n=1 Tax=Methyloferula stellata TaxID=876270 RepID=UPI00037AC359|nr:protein-methionine-sulfoxide reductase heme-binding subunit MsrQ [Methyloferula stellata]